MLDRIEQCEELEMIVKQEYKQIRIILESDDEAQIMAASLNWSVNAMSKEHMVDVYKDGDERTKELCRIHHGMWESFIKVYPFSHIVKLKEVTP